MNCLCQLLKSGRVSLTTLLVVLLGTGVSFAQDAILIVGMAPTSFEDGRETQVQVTVVYDLVSSDEAVIDLSTNELRAQAFHPVAHASVKKGRGTITLSGKVVPRYWTPGTPAKIAVHLWRIDDTQLQRRALATDDVRLTVARRARQPEANSGQANPAEIYDDTVSIKSVFPEDLREGKETDVAVTVAYELFSREEGEINLGYNLGRGSGYRIIGKTRVANGTGETVIQARILPMRTGNLPFAKLT